MTTKNIKEIYENHIKSLPAVDRLRRFELIAHGLATAGGRALSSSRSLLELEGLRAEMWPSNNAQPHADELREEWDQRP